MKYHELISKRLLEDINSFVKYSKVTNYYRDDVENTKKISWAIYRYFEYSHAKYTVEPYNRHNCLFQISHIRHYFKSFTINLDQFVQLLTNIFLMILNDVIINTL